MLKQGQVRAGSDAGSRPAPLQTPKKIKTGELLPPPFAFPVVVLEAGVCMSLRFQVDSLLPAPTRAGAAWSVGYGFCSMFVYVLVCLWVLLQSACP